MERPSEFIIKKFFENSCGEDEYNRVISYLNTLSNDELNKFMDSHINRIEKNEIFVNKLHNSDFNKVLSKLNVYHTFKIQSRRKFIYSLAASIIFLIIISTSLIYYFHVFKGSNSISWGEKITQSGHKSELTLSDGTKIILNAESKLKYPVKFQNNLREVYLEGEAYFEVKHDASKPFVVHSGNLSITVLGTKFNVDAFPEEKTVEISLVEGKVKIYKNIHGNIDEVGILKPNQQLLYNKDKNKSIFSEFDPQKVIGWKDNIYQFNDEPLGEILSHLEREYGIEFELAEKSLDNFKITVTFKNSSLHTISEVIKKSIGADYKTIMENNHIKKIVFFNIH